MGSENCCNNILRIQESIILCFFFVIVCSIFYTIVPELDRATNLLYVSVIFISVTTTMLSQMNRKFNPILLFLAFSLLIFILAFRNISGIDDPTYESIFYSVKENGFFKIFLEKTSEPGYLFFNQFISLFTNNYYIAQFIFSAIPLLLFYATFLKMEDYLNLPLAMMLLISLFFFQMLSVSLVRMFIAISIVFYSFTFVESNQPQKYLACIIVSFLFHYSSGIMFVFYPFIYRKDFIINYWIKIILFSPIFLFLFSFVFVYFLLPFLGSRYGLYTFGSNIVKGFSVSTLSMLPFLFVACYFRYVIPKKAQNIYYFALILLALSSIVSLFSILLPIGRIIFYMNLSMLIIFPMLFKYIDSGLIRLLLGLFLIIYAFLYIYVTQYTILAQYGHLFPYKNIFFIL